jgi:glycosyltransferase involved in cell wall biosynthesis
MHICFLSQEFPKPGSVYGGIGTFLLTFSNHLIGKGHQVTVVGLIGSEHKEEWVNGVRLVYFPLSNFKLLGWWRNFRRIGAYLQSLHQTHPIDVLEGSELNFAFVPKINGIQYVIRLHGGHHFFSIGENRKIEKWKGFQERVSFSKADAFIAVSEYVKTVTGTYLPFGTKPIEVINYPVSFEKFHPADPSKVIPFRLVFAGTVCEKKGIRQLILALPEVLEQYPETHLEVYGRDWYFKDGSSYTEYLKSQIPDWLWSKVTFHGPVSHQDLPGYYEQAQVCVFPSHIETQGLVAPEAMAMQKPVIFSETGPGPETIDDGINGWLCNPLDPQDIAKTIIQAFEAWQNYPSIGQLARQKALAKFDPKEVTEKNLAFYQKLGKS